MIGLPDCNSSRERPKFMYRSRYRAVMSVLAGSSNQARERRVARSGFDAVIAAVPAARKNQTNGTTWRASRDPDPARSPRVAQSRLDEPRNRLLRAHRLLVPYR